MSARFLTKLPLSVYKPSRTTFVHKISRNSLLKDPKVRFPIYSRLPSFWREEFESPEPNLHQDFETGTYRPQHSGLWKLVDGKPQRVENISIYLKYCKEADESLWGGETIIEGFRYPGNGRRKKRLEYKWYPTNFERTFYSEILDRNITTSVTPRTLDLIDDSFGFDFFILKTHVKILRKFGSSLKREMLMKLANKDTDLYPYDLEKQEKIYKKYEKHVVDLDQASWTGLTLYEAMKKQYEIEKSKGFHSSKPLLEVYKEELIKKLNLESSNESLLIFDKTTN